MSPEEKEKYEKIQKKLEALERVLLFNWRGIKLRVKRLEGELAKEGEAAKNKWRKKFEFDLFPQLESPQKPGYIQPPTVKSAPPVHSEYQAAVSAHELETGAVARHVGQEQLARQQQKEYARVYFGGAKVVPVFSSKLLSLRRERGTADRGTGPRRIAQRVDGRRPIYAKGDEQKQREIQQYERKSVLLAKHVPEFGALSARLDRAVLGPVNSLYMSILDGCFEGIETFSISIMGGQVKQLRSRLQTGDTLSLVAEQLEHIDTWTMLAVEQLPYENKSDLKMPKPQAGESIRA